MNDSVKTPAYGPSHECVDYILGITFEIWEQGNIGFIRDYYSADIEMATIDGLTVGNEAIVEGTAAMLRAFPDRKLLADDVIYGGTGPERFYSSHRIVSPMTNLGATAFGPATGRSVRIMTIADCLVENGVITGEWLVRDNHALVVQLGFDPIEAARVVRASRSAENHVWIRRQIEELRARESARVHSCVSPALFARRVIGALWRGEASSVSADYAPYAVMHRSPIVMASGRESIFAHYDELASAFRAEAVSVDHVIVKPTLPHESQMAVRWSVAATHVGPYLGLPATGRSVYLLGVTHWRLVEGRIAVEWTIFDGLGVLSQLVD